MEYVLGIRVGVQLEADGNDRCPHRRGEEGFVGTIVPLLAFGPKDSVLALDAGVGVALLTRYKFGEQISAGLSNLR